MSVAQGVLAVVVSALAIGALVRLLRRTLRGHTPKRSLSVAYFVAGALAAAVALATEGLVLSWLDLSIVATRATAVSAMLVMILFVAPLEEGLKFGIAWSSIRFGHVRQSVGSISVAVIVAAGFATAESVWLSLTRPLSLYSAAQVLVALPPHFLCAGLWSYVLGRGKPGQRRAIVALVWGATTLAHAVCDHIVFGRGPGMLAFAAPPMAALAVLFWVAVRDAVRSRPRSSRESIPPAEPVPLRVMRRALRQSNQPLMLHWIGIGALVNIGVVVACLALAVYVGHRLGLNFADADETDLRANAPIVLLGTAVLAAFPLAGFLVARASRATSVLEPALATAVAIFAVVGLVSAMSPVAVLFALAVAPIAFGLACGGAWFGRDQ